MQKHEGELKGITERYLDEKKEEPEKKTKTQRLLPVLKKYGEIVQSKQVSSPAVADDEEFSGGGGMRMDSKNFIFRVS